MHHDVALILDKPERHTVADRHPSAASPVSTNKSQRWYPVNLVHSREHTLSLWPTTLSQPINAMYFGMNPFIRL